MNIAIVEIMPIGHYTLVESIAKIFLSDTQNKITIYTHSQGENILRDLKEKFKQIEIITVEIPNDNSVKKLILEINRIKYDRSYIVTLEKYFKSFAENPFNHPSYLFIHNIYLWYKTGFNDSMKRFWSDIKGKKNVIYSFKTNFIAPRYRKRILNNVKSSKGKMVVLNDHLKTELQIFENSNCIEVIPFSMADEALISFETNNTLFRICIPGMVSQLRRDYLSFFQALRKNDFLKNKIEIDLLGGVSESEGGRKIINEANALKTEGWNIEMHDKALVPLYEFDEYLKKADIILGNLHVTIDENNIYGKSKDSGIIYTMIKAGKPGLLPHDYNNIKELESSTIKFEDYNQLVNKIEYLVLNPKDFIELKKKAKSNSNYFSPEILYQKLVN